MTINPLVSFKFSEFMKDFFIYQDDAANNGDIVTVITRDEVEVIGYIEDETIAWNEWIDGHGVGRFVLIKR